MPERRSLSSAMELTPEKLAFIQGKQVEKERPLATPPSQPVAPVNVTESRNASDDAAEARRSPVRSPTVRRTMRPRVNREPVPVPNLDHLRVGVTVRIHPEIANALRRAHLEQKIRRQSPGTQQEIVEVALSDWLERNGFLDV